MRKFLVKVNGSDYEIEVEEIAGSQAAAASRSASAPAPEAAATPKREEAPKEEKKVENAPADAQGGAAAMSAPMPGSIVSVAVKTGDAVIKGQLLLVLEAMKMENEIVAPQDGTVTAVHVQAGASVDSGAPLLTIE